MSSHGPSVPLQDFPDLSPEEMTARAEAFRDELRRRRTVRDFSTRSVPRKVIEACLEGAAAAPNGANLQPWHFVVISSPELKHRIRLAAEKEEKAFYSGRAPEEWLEVLGPLGTDAEKPFLEDAPYLIAVFAESYHVNEDGTRRKNYYVTESVGIATGMLITALHTSGLATLTHTPSPMGFLNELLDRPPNERAFLLLVVGYPAPDAQVPEISKKPLEEIATFLD